MSMKNSGRVAASLHRRLRVGHADDGLGRGGRRDDDVHLGQDRADVVEGDRGARQRPRQLAGPARQRAVGHVERHRAVLHAGAGRPARPSPPRPRSSTALPSRLAEDLPRQLHRRERDGDGEPPDLGLRAHALGHAEGLAHEGVEHRARPSGTPGPARRRPSPAPGSGCSPTTIESRLAATRNAWRMASSSVACDEVRLDGRPAPCPGARPARGRRRRAPRPALRPRRTPPHDCRSRGSSARRRRRAPRGPRAPRGACPPRGRATRAAPPARCGGSSPPRRASRSCAVPPRGGSTPAHRVSRSRPKPAMAK